MRRFRRSGNQAQMLTAGAMGENVNPAGGLRYDDAGAGWSAEDYLIECAGRFFDACDTEATAEAVASHEGEQVQVQRRKIRS